MTVTLEEECHLALKLEYDFEVSGLKPNLFVFFSSGKILCFKDFQFGLSHSSGEVCSLPRQQ